MKGLKNLLKWNLHLLMASVGLYYGLTPSKLIRYNGGDYFKFCQKAIERATRKYEGE